MDPEQGDIHDRNIEQDHELRGPGQGEDDSFAGVCPAAPANSPATVSSDPDRAEQQQDYGRPDPSSYRIAFTCLSVVIWILAPTG